MAFSNSDWIVKLYYAFQDAKNASEEWARDASVIVVASSCT